MTAGDWRNAVRETHDLLVTVTGSNLLDRQQMRSLRQELEQTVARARPTRRRLAMSWPACGTWWLIALSSCFATADPPLACAISALESCLLGPRIRDSLGDLLRPLLESLREPAKLLDVECLRAEPAIKT